jgi:NAD-dependent SIR2 family protein deacetylase
LSQADQELIRSIAREVEAGSCVFFLGAGVSIEAGMPGGSELAEMLARKAGWEYNGEPLQQIAGKYATLRSPVKSVIHDYLKRCLSDAKVGHIDAHHALACMADKLDVILTTNWDNLLEDAFDASRTARDSYQRVYRDVHVPTLQSAKTTIVKLHGHIDDPSSYVVTQEDCKAFQRRHPRLADYLRVCLATSTLVIVGYGQGDEDFEDIYEGVLSDRQPGEEQRPVYVVNPREDIAWEQYWRDKARQRFIRMSATGFLTRVYREVRSIADRDRELKVGRDLIPCPQRKPVVEFFGLPGVGKSTLLARIRKEYEKSDIYTASIDFGNPDFCEDGKASYLLIWGEVAQQLGVQASYGSKEELTEQLQRKRSVVLFFDTVDRAPADTLRWLGETFVALTDDLPDLRAVFACRFSRLPSELAFPLKRKVETQRLTPFRRFADARRQMELEFFYDEALARLVFSLTLGHPGMVQRVMEWLRARGVRNRAELDSNAQVELGQFVDELLDAYILKDVDDDLKPVVRQLVYYRQFAWKELSPILDISVLECDAFVRERLWPTGLLERDRGLYAVDETARELLLNIALVEDTSRFIAVNAEIGGRYEEQARALTDNWHLHVVERLYHLVNELRGRRQAGEAVDAAAALLPTLEGHLQEVTSEENIIQLRDSLQDDGELEALAEQVQSGLYSAMVQIVEEMVS